MSDKKFRVLSLDGGGIRGIFPAVILSEIEKVTNLIYDYLYNKINAEKEDE